MSDDEDPFEDLDAPEDEDPFADFETPGDTDDEDAGADDWADADPGPGRMEGDPFDRGADAAGGATPADAGESPADPFADFADVAGEDDPFEAFEEAGVEDVDPETVWASLSEPGGSEAADGDDRVFSEVSKHRFCERCEHFFGPPEVECGYEGAAIVAFTDMETVRVVDCPVVAEQRALEGEGSGLD